MARARFVPHPVSSLRGEPFASSEEAWFWFIQCHQARRQGARISSGLALVPRPCEPIDVILTVETLRRRRWLEKGHVDILLRFGKMMIVPDPSLGGELRAARLWAEAHARLGDALREKGIIAGENAGEND